MSAAHDAYILDDISYSPTRDTMNLTRRQSGSSITTPTVSISPGQLLDDTDDFGKKLLRPEWDCLRRVDPAGLKPFSRARPRRVQERPATSEDTSRRNHFRTTSDGVATAAAAFTTTTATTTTTTTSSHVVPFRHAKPKADWVKKYTYDDWVNSGGVMTYEAWQKLHPEEGAIKTESSPEQSRLASDAREARRKNVAHGPESTRTQSERPLERPRQRARLQVEDIVKSEPVIAEAMQARRVSAERQSHARKNLASDSELDIVKSRARLDSRPQKESTIEVKPEAAKPDTRSKVQEKAQDQQSKVTKAEPDTGSSTSQTTVREITHMQKTESRRVVPVASNKLMPQASGCQHCGCNGQHTSVWRQLWTELCQNFYTSSSRTSSKIWASIPQPTWLGWLVLLWLTWYIIERALCLRYCYKPYAAQMTGYGVAPDAPDFPFVLPTLLWRGVSIVMGDGAGTYVAERAYVPRASEIARMRGANSTWRQVTMLDYS